MGVWGVILLVFLEDDGKTYAKTDKQMRHHIFVGDKQAEKKQILSQIYEKNHD